MNSANLVAGVHWKVWKERALSTEEPCTCEYVTWLESFHIGTLSIRWYIAQNFSPTFSMSVSFRRSFKTVICSRILKVAIATSKFMNEVYNGRYLRQSFKFSMLKETIEDYVYKT